MASRDIWQNAMPKVNFAEAYNTDRYDEKADGEIGWQEGKVASFLARFQSQKEPASPVRNMYTIVRSDLEEDKALDYQDDLHLPGMPRTWHGVAARAKDLERALHPGPEEVSRFDMLSCVDSPFFGGLSGMVICTNALIIGLETDIVSSAWWWMDQFMLAFFCTELCLKLCRHGLEYFRSEDEWIWNLFDLCIVVCGAFDQWFMPLYQAVKASIDKVEGTHQGRSKMTVIFMLLRMARLLRIVRLFRLIKIIQPLYELAQGILEALQGMFWVLVFMIMTMYACAMLCTLFIGDGELFALETAPEDTAAFREMFQTVSSSLFALFGTMSSWSLTKLVPLFKEVPAFRLFFVIFYIYSSWALLAVMTGVVSENMIAIREQMLKEDQKREEMRKEHIIHFLGDLFQKADADNSGQISKDEFDMLLRAPDLTKKLLKYSKMEPKDLEELFEWIDHDNSGTINMQEFMDGFKWINEPLRAKSLVKVNQRLGDDIRALRKSVVDAIESKSEEVNSLLSEPLRKVHAICEQMQTLDSTFGEFAQEVSKPLDMPTKEELQAVEERLSNKLMRVRNRLEQVENRVR